MSSNRVRNYQIRVNSLHLGKPLIIDGIMGPKTRHGINLAMNKLQVRTRREILDPSGINRVHWHWTVSNYNVTSKVKNHYNGVIDNYGNFHEGGAPAIDQANYRARHTGVSHTRNGNTGSIGLAVAACVGYRVVNWHKGIVEIGKYPLNWNMIDGMLAKTAEYCKLYDIKVSPWTTITHAEVQDNIGIKQRGKWDIRVLPDNPTKLLGVREAGDILRKRLLEKFL